MVGDKSACKCHAHEFYLLVVPFDRLPLDAVVARVGLCVVNLTRGNGEWDAVGERVATDPAVNNIEVAAVEATRPLAHFATALEAALRRTRRLALAYLHEPGAHGLVPGTLL